MKKNTLFIIALGTALLMGTTSCNDWLDLRPNNEQVTDEFWKTKEDVEAVVASGYSYLREETETLMLLGELRGGTLYTINSGKDVKIQNFDVLPTNDLVSYSNFYRIISMANSVIRYAPQVMDADDTYYTSMMQSHLCEAYFLRAYVYSILIKNWKEVPLVLEPYVNDNQPLDIEKSSESAVIAQIKSDIQTALATGAAKSTYETEWQTKGRATKWALYALMADVCLWNHEYDECVKYADLILNAKEAMRPVFITDMSHIYDIFYPGLSNESIFELYYDYNTEAKTNGLMGMFPATAVLIKGEGALNVSDAAAMRMMQETAQVAALHPELQADGRVGRMRMVTYGESPSVVWKYRGTDIVDANTVRQHSDANFILYRVAEVILMKAEALVMKDSWREAIAEINRIRRRAGLSDYVDLNADTAAGAIESLDQLSLLSEILEQREMEFVAEGKRWYDLLRIARYDRSFVPEGMLEEGSAMEHYATGGFGADEFAYKSRIIELIASANTTTSSAQIRSVLQNSWAWYLPISYSEISVVKGMKQNPFYE